MGLEVLHGSPRGVGQEHVVALAVTSSAPMASAFRAKYKVSESEK